MEWDLKLLIQFREYKEMICFKKIRKLTCATALLTKVQAFLNLKKKLWKPVIREKSKGNREK